MAPTNQVILLFIYSHLSSIYAYLLTTAHILKARRTVQHQD
jgi:hypothetical protein